MKQDSVSTKRKSAERSLWLQWLVFSVLSWAAVWAVLCTLLFVGQSHGVHILLAAGLLVGCIVVGIAQWLIIQRHIHRNVQRVMVIVTNLAIDIFVASVIVVGPLTMAAWSVEETTLTAKEYLPVVAVTGAIGGAIGGSLGGIFSGFLLDFLRS